jgi:predicted RNase H-like HicB family nuclease
MMQLRGRVFKVGKFWAVECLTLGAHTQGTSKKDALEMMKDWVQSMLDRPDFEFDISPAGGNEFVMSFPDPKPVLGLMINQLRNQAEIPIRDLAKKIGKKSQTSVAQYLNGKHVPGIEVTSTLLGALGYDLEISARPRASAAKSKKMA